MAMLKFANCDSHYQRVNITMRFYKCWLILVNDGYPLVNVYIANWKITMLSMGKSTISTGPFSIAIVTQSEGRDDDDSSRMGPQFELA